MPRSPFVTLFLACALAACSSLDGPSAKVETPRPRRIPPPTTVASSEPAVIGLAPADAAAMVVAPIVEYVAAREEAEVGAYLVAVDASNRAAYASLVAQRQAAAAASARAAQQQRRPSSSSSYSAPAPASSSRGSGGAHSDAWWHGVTGCEQSGRDNPTYGYFSIMDGSAAGKSWGEQEAIANGIISRYGDSAWAASCVAAGYAASPGG